MTAELKKLIELPVVLWLNQKTNTYHNKQHSATSRSYALPRVKYIRADIATAQLDKMRDALESCLTDMTDGDTVEPDGYLRSIKLAQAALRDMEG